MVSLPMVFELGVAASSAVPVTGLVTAQTHNAGVWWVVGGALALVLAILIWRR
ncbi:hypothetical protein HY492_01555 [Candidatus Woesearchaeota archaeon]|nr:hypothetical protein [Candidatus Woesearchaeota archaeon]